MAQRLRSIEGLPEEAAELAEAASRHIDANPESRRAFAELAVALGAGASISAVAAGTGWTAAATTMPVLLAAVAGLITARHRSDERSIALPEAERELWEEAGASFSPAATDAAALRAASAFADLLDRSLVGDGAVADALEVDRSRVSQRLRDRSLYAFGDGETRFFPRWQFSDGRTIPGLRDVLHALDEQLHPLVVDHWFTTPSLELTVNGDPVSPEVWLRTAGASDRAATLASDL